MTEQAVLLQLDQVSKLFGGLAAVDRVSFAVAPGQVLGLIGPNGAGKTTLINIISGLTPLSHGAVHFAGQDITAWPAHRIAQAGIARTYQNIRLFGDGTVLDNLLIAQHGRTRAGLLSAVLALPAQRREEKTLRARAGELLRSMHMQGYGEALAGELAYGDQRRVEIIRALATDPRLLLLDEPSAGMNEAETEQLGAYILSLRERGMTILIVEHDMNLIDQVCDDVVVLNFGQVISQGSPAAIKGDPLVVEAYLGEDAVDS